MDDVSPTSPKGINASRFIDQSKLTEVVDGLRKTAQHSLTL